LVVSDSGPDNLDSLEEEVAKLREIGVVTVQFYIEDGTSNEEREATKLRLASIFDHQIVFDADSIDNMIEVLASILKALYR